MKIERIEGHVMTVNSFLVHGPAGLVLIDGQLTVSDAALVRAAIVASASELAGVIVTHPHPDHYAGLASIIDGPDIPVVATADVDAIMRRDDALKDTIVGPMMGEEWPSERVYANHLVQSGAVVSLGGVEFTVEAVGSAESDADSLWRLETGDVFAGDLAYNEHHAYLADGNWRDWLVVLERLERDLADARAVHVGHGASTSADAFARQRRYIEMFVDAVRANDDAIRTGDHRAVLSRMAESVANDSLLFLMDLSIDPMHAAINASYPTRDA